MEGGSVPSQYYLFLLAPSQYLSFRISPAESPRPRPSALSPSWAPLGPSTFALPFHPLFPQFPDPSLPRPLLVPPWLPQNMRFARSSQLVSRSLSLCAIRSEAWIKRTSWRFASTIVKTPTMADSITQGVLGSWEKSKCPGVLFSPQSTSTCPPHPTTWIYDVNWLCFRGG